MTVKNSSFEVVSTVAMWTIVCEFVYTGSDFWSFPGGKRCLYIGAGFSRRDVSGTVTNRHYICAF
jgi:hypothetical protein